MCRALVSFLFATILAAAAAGSPLADEPPKLEFELKDGRLKIGESKPDGSFGPTVHDDSPGFLTNPKHVTSDINSPGWITGKDGIGVQRLWWRGIQTDCLPCRGLVANFNAVMDQLLLVRYQRQEAKFRHDAFTKKMRAQMASEKMPSDPKAAEAASARRLGTLVDVGERFKKIDAELAAQEKLLAAQAQELRRQIADCEKQCQGKVTKTSGIKLGGLPALSGAGTPPKGSASSFSALPIAWKGPYPAVCVKCAKLAEHLNKLADWARRLQLAKASAERELKLADMQWQLVQSSYHYGYVYDPANLQQIRNGTKRDIETLDSYIAVLKRNFSQTLAAYEKCIKTCKPDERQAALTAPDVLAPRSEPATTTPDSTQQTLPNETKTATKAPSTKQPVDTGGATASSHPDHPGWYTYYGVLRPSSWIDHRTECPPCKPLAASYNEVMRSLFKARFQLQLIDNHRQHLKKEQESAKAQGESGKGQARDNAGLSAQGEKSAASRMNYQSGVTDLSNKVRPQLQSLISNLEIQAATLRGKLKACEAECTEIASESKLVSGRPVSLPLLQPPFSWQGPYPEVCKKCAALAARLNALPRKAHETMGQLTAARARKQLTEAEIQIIRALDEVIDYASSGTPEEVRATTSRRLSNDSKTKQRRLEELQREASDAQRQVNRLEQNLRDIARNFKVTLMRYNDCIKTCKTKTACYTPERSYEQVAIGPNETYGSGAEIKETAKSLFGGGGGLGSLGGGGSTFGGKPRGTGTFSEKATRGGGGGKGPETVDDPTSGSFFRARAGAVDMQLRGNFVDDGLLVSAKLDDVPGDGTFHAMWLEDNEGRIIRPTRYLPFSMYRDWQLKVWWTYDRWVDGQHVEHREGGWTETWREERDGLLALYGGEEGVKSSIWHSQGFDTPVRGLQHIGAFFPVTVADLSGPCPLRLVTHVALPEEDPVVTQPFVNDLSLAADTASSSPDNDILVNIRQTVTF